MNSEMIRIIRLSKEEKKVLCDFFEMIACMDEVKSDDIYCMLYNLAHNRDKYKILDDNFHIRFEIKEWLKMMNVIMTTTVKVDEDAIFEQVIDFIKEETINDDLLVENLPSETQQILFMEIGQRLLNYANNISNFI